MKQQPPDQPRVLAPRPRVSRRGRVLATLGLCLVLAAQATAAAAADKARMAVTLAQQASKSFESGDFSRASEFYLAAWRTDPKPDFLFGAARSAHLAALNDKAVELYGQFMATEGADPERQKRAKEYLAELELAKVQSRVAEAERVQRDDPKVAAGLYMDAYKLAPTRLELLFKAAVAEAAAHDAAAAERLLREYLQKAPANAPDRNQAQARLESLTRKAQDAQEPRAETHPEPRPESRPEPRQEVVPAPATASGTPGTGPTAAQPGQVAEPAATGKPRWAGWALVGGGSAVALAGIVLYAMTTPDISAYNAAMANKDAEGKTIGLSAQEAQSRSASINARVAAGWAMTGIGAAAAGVGAWWLLTTPDKAVTWIPGPGFSGAGVAIRF